MITGLFMLLLWVGFERWTVPTHSIRVPPDVFNHFLSLIDDEHKT